MKVGDKVEIIDQSEMYLHYGDWAELYNLDKFKYGGNMCDGHIFTVKAVGNHIDEEDETLVGITNGMRDYIIDLSGLKTIPDIETGNHIITHCDPMFDKSTLGTEEDLHDKINTTLPRTKVKLISSNAYSNINIELTIIEEANDLWTFNIHNATEDFCSSTTCSPSDRYIKDMLAVFGFELMLPKSKEYNEFVNELTDRSDLDK